MAEKQGIFQKIKSYFSESKTELKKVVWPTQKTVWKNTGIVLAMIFVMGVFVALLDMGLMKGLSSVMLISTYK